jgi:hypothetical protein
MFAQTKALSTLLAVAMGATVAAAQSKRSADDPGQKEIYNYILTMDKVQKIGAATKTLQALAKQHPELNDTSQANTLDETVQKLEKYPDAIAVIKKNGMAPREYIVGVMCVMQAGMAVGFKKSGTYKEYPPDMLKLVSKANLDFVEQHWDDFQKLTKMDDDK